MIDQCNNIGANRLPDFCLYQASKYPKIDVATTTANIRTGRGRDDSPATLIDPADNTCHSPKPNADPTKVALADKVRRNIPKRIPLKISSSIMTVLKGIIRNA